VNRKEQPNTLDMARTVLRNAGTEKSPDDLKVMIRTTYGIDPAKTLDQMLYKRASAGREFYKTEDGRFGLLELRKTPVIQEIRTPSTASA
jgi:alkyl hydroperoxide reductase subunit AhpC